MNVTILNCLSPAALLILWFIVFIVLTDFNCPLFYTCYACSPFWARRKYGRGPER